MGKQVIAFHSHTQFSYYHIQFPDPPRDSVGKHHRVVLVHCGVLSLLADVSQCRGDGWAGGQPLQVVHLLLSLHPGSLRCHSARLPQDSVSAFSGGGYRENVRQILQ